MNRHIKKSAQSEALSESPCWFKDMKNMYI